MNKFIGPTYNFDDVLIIPKASELKSRSEVNLEVSYITKHSKKRICGVPVIVANMSSVATTQMAEALYSHKMFVALHKFIPEEELMKFLLQKESAYSFITVGGSDDELDRLTRIFNKRWDFWTLESPTQEFICIDVANGYTYAFLDQIKKIRDRNSDSIIMAGNVCTPDGVENVIKAGADIVKCGIANGSGCDTKNKAAVGYKQLSVAIECGQAANELNALCCSDGGCKTPADICKALGGGSHFVMAGGMFSGYDQNDQKFLEYYVHPLGFDYPLWTQKDVNGDFVIYNPDAPTSLTFDKETSKIIDKRFKFFGMSSKFANNEYSGGLKDYRTSEGKEFYVPYRGDVSELVQDIKGGLASCCTYTNTRNLENLHKNCQFSF